jgi:hypothetical protein
MPSIGTSAKPIELDISSTLGKYAIVWNPTPSGILIQVCYGMTFGGPGFQVFTHEPVTKAHPLPRITASSGKEKRRLDSFESRLPVTEWKSR